MNTQASVIPRLPRLPNTTIFERVPLGDGRRTLALYEATGNLGEDGASRLLGAAEILKFPEKDDNYAYLSTIGRLIPTSQPETVEEAHTRLRERVGEIVQDLSRLAAGETLSVEEVLELDDVVQRACDLSERGNSFGKVIIQYAID